MKIKPDKWYTLADLHKHKMLWWVSSFWGVRKYVLLDHEHDNILKAVVTGQGTGRKYKIKGENILRYIKAFEEGKIKN